LTQVHITLENRTTFSFSLTVPYDGKTYMYVTASDIFIHQQLYM